MVEPTNGEHGSEVTTSGEVTKILIDWRGGNDEAFERLLPLVYAELRQLASGYLRREREGHTLQPTALVHEAYLRLASADNMTLQDQSHFFAVAARAMRRILVDHARGQGANKRVGAHLKMPLEEGLLVADDSGDHVVEIHEALEELAKSHPRKAELVELRFFGGLSEEEAAEVMQASRSTLTRDWRFARLWLYRRLGKTDKSG